MSGRAAGTVGGRPLVTAALLFSLAGAVTNLVLAAVPATSAALPWAVLGPALIAVGAAAAYPTLQLELLDMFPSTRGAVVSLFTFVTLLLNGIAASALAPLVTGSVLRLAAASTAMVAAGMLCWAWHLRSVRPVRP